MGKGRKHGLAQKQNDAEDADAADFATGTVLTAKLSANQPGGVKG